MKQKYNKLRILSVAALFVVFAITASVRGQVAADFSDDAPDQRVARIKTIEGDVRLKRNDVDTWEAAEQNVPIVSGDELATGPDGKAEIQFDLNTYVRIGANSILKIKTLDDAGIALGLSRGVAIAVVRKFDRDNGFFEIDLPETTVAVLKSGVYRFESLDFADGEVRIAVSGGGEARIYSADSGFRLRSGRMARVAISGDFAGDWSTADYNPPVDDLDRWSAFRQTEIDRRIASAYYDKYYDDNIYGADELNGYGDWEFTSDYGYVWRPNSYAIRGYSDWSPYRYGRWRWTPPIGWTWVSDEPWGWATYHYGRWVWYRGRWVWSPYGYYRSNRSRWYPALVVIYVVNNDVCWYPLGYRDRYRRFNNYHDWVGNRDRRRPATAGYPSGGGTINGENRLPAGRRPPLGRQSPEIDENTNLPSTQNRSYIPPNAIISMRKESFLAQRRDTAPAPPEIIRVVTRRAENPETNTPDVPPVPVPGETELRRVVPPLVSNVSNVNTGAAPRSSPGPMDQQLRRGRVIVDGNQPQQPVRTTPGETQLPTGAVNRSQEVRRTQTQPPLGQPTGTRREEDVPIFRPAPPSGTNQSKKEEAETPPKRESPPPRGNDSPPFNPTPRREPAPPPKQDAPRPQPPPKRESPPPRGNDSPPFNPTPRREPAPPPKQDAPRPQPPPKQEQPRSEPPRKQEPPPEKPNSRIRSKEDGQLR